MSALISLGGKCKYTNEIAELVGSTSPVIAADRGYVHCRSLGVIPDFLVGDMDSIPGELLIQAKADAATTIKYFDKDKDQTDSEIAADIAVAEGCSEILFIGAFGERYDHMLGNQMMAASLAARGIQCVLTDGDTYMYTLTPENSPYLIEYSLLETDRRIISIIPIVGDINEVDISGLKYPLSRMPVPIGSQRAVSNELLSNYRPGNDKALISVSNGVAMIIMSKEDL